MVQTILQNYGNNHGKYSDFHESIRRKTIFFLLQMQNTKLIVSKLNSTIFLPFFLEEDFTAEEFPEEFMPPPMRDDFVMRDEVPQNNLIPDKGMSPWYMDSI